METLVWIVTALLMIAGLIGTLVPLIPGAALIVAGAVLHQMALPEGESVGWGVIVVLLLLALISYAVDFAASALGAKRFGASKWGALGALLGAIVGLFFSLPGMLIGPIVGVFAAEILFARKQMKQAARASWGTIVGALLGALGKLALAVLMVALFWAALLWRKPPSASGDSRVSSVRTSMTPE